ncbi:Uncharacterised protein [Vibrio cholerae]|nr:Uncharacterised protein [Vibrio cholerae]
MQRLIFRSGFVLNTLKTAHKFGVGFTQRHFRIMT